MKIRILLFVTLVFASALFAQEKTAFSLNDWMSTDAENKKHLVLVLIDAVSEDGITLRLPAEHYVKAIDNLVANSVSNGDTAGLEGSLGVAFKTIAVMDFDWNNGKDYLQYAKEMLGPEVFAAFREMYPEKYKRLEQGCK